MDTILQIISRGVDELLGRASGPLNFRLFVMPTVVTVLAIRAGLRDARDGQPAYLWAMLTKPIERRRLFRSGMKDLEDIHRGGGARHRVPAVRVAGVLHRSAVYRNCRVRYCAVCADPRPNHTSGPQILQEAYKGRPAGAQTQAFLQ